MNKGKRYLLHWRYSDGSGSGVLPRVISSHDKELLELIEEEIGFDRHIEFVEERRRKGNE